MEMICGMIEDSIYEVRTPFPIPGRRRFTMEAVCTRI